MQLRAQAEIDGVRLLASLAADGHGAAIVPATAVPHSATGRFGVVRVPELPPPVVALAHQRRPAPSAPTRALFEVLRDVVGDRARQQPGVRVGAERVPAEPGDLIGERTLAAARPRRVAADVTRPVARRDRAAARRAAPVSAEVRVLDGIDGPRRVVWVESGGETASGFRGVPLSSTIAAVAADAARTALAEHLPLVLLLASTGSDIVEGIAALEGWGSLAKALVDCSGIVPTIVVVDGPAVSGPALLLGVADLVVMTASSYGFVNGPVMVEEFTGVRVTTAELGGAGELARHTGVPALVVPTREAALEAVGRPPRLPPRQRRRRGAAWPCDDPVDRACPEAGALIPPVSTGSYDVRQVAAAIVDADSLLEVRARWAANVVTAFATVAGRPIGIVANQPMALAGTLDIPASQKAARFVAFCDAYNLPILTLVDTPGFYPGKDLEWRGMIRHGAQLVFAYGRATVPRICVILRKSYGGAYIVMDSKRMGNDVCFAWPWAELAVMGAGQAAAILQRRATPEERAAFEADYAERLLNPYVAAERGFIDAVIDPADTRREVAAALAALADKREVLVDSQARQRAAVTEALAGTHCQSD